MCFPILSQCSLCLPNRWLPYHMCFPLLSQCSFMSFHPMVAISHVFSIIITVFFYVFPTDGCHITCVFHYYHSVLLCLSNRWLPYHMCFPLLTVLLCLSIRWLPYHMCFPLLSQCSFMSFQPMVTISHVFSIINCSFMSFHPMVTISHVFSIIITVFFYVFPTDGCHITCVFHY